MQKSVLIPFEKYERLNGKLRETKEVGSQTENAKFSNDLQSKKEADEVELKLTPSSNQDEQPATAEPNLKKVKNRASRKHYSPPGKRDRKGLWLKLNGRL